MHIFIMAIRLFFRQPFTQNTSTNHISKLHNLLDQYSKYHIKINPYKSASNKDTFKKEFEDNTSIPFTPENFRNHRLNCIRKSNCMLIVRNNLSESTAFELGYIYAKYPHLPIFYAIDKKYPIKSTLIKDLHPNVLYYNYNKPEDLTQELYEWLDSIGNNNNIKHFYYH